MVESNHFRMFAAVAAVVLVAGLLVALGISPATSQEAGTDVTTQPPAGTQPEAPNYDAEGPAEGPAAAANSPVFRVFKNFDAWFGDGRDNATLSTMGKIRGQDWFIDPVLACQSGIPSGTDVAVFTSNGFGDPSTTAQQNDPACQSALQTFLGSGGTLIVDMGDNDSSGGFKAPGANGTPSYVFPSPLDDATQTPAAKGPDGILGTGDDHPIVKGPDKVAGTADDLTDSNIDACCHVAHGNLADGITLPNDATILMTANFGGVQKPILAEYKHGGGRVILDTLTKESFIHQPQGSGPSYFLRNLFEYAQTETNQAPVVKSAAADTLGTEGDTLQTSGSFFDPGNDSLALTADNQVGTFTDNGDGTWSWQLSTNDDVSKATITVTADDRNGGTVTDSFDYGADNANPELSALSLTGNTGTTCATNNVGLSFTFSDPGSGDTHSGTIDWGDGSSDTTFSSSPVDESHDYDPGSYTITVNVSDDDGGSDSDTGSVSRQYQVSNLLSPVNADGSSVSKYGSTIPLKVRITDCNDNLVSGLTPKISFTKVNPATPVVGINEGTSTQPYDTDFVMRPSDDFYIYNLATKSLADGDATYAAIIEDSTTPKAFGPTQSQTFGLRTK